MRKNFFIGPILIIVTYNERFKGAAPPQIQLFQCDARGYNGCKNFNFKFARLRKKNAVKFKKIYHSTTLF